MASNNTTVDHEEPDIILYDLACTKGVCFSPVVWRTRMMLNYKKIPYKTIFLEFPDIAPTLRDLGVASNPKSHVPYTVPTITHLASNTTVNDSPAVAAFIEKAYPAPAVPLSSPFAEETEALARDRLFAVFRNCLMAKEMRILSPRAQEYFRATREKNLGRTLESFEDKEVQEATWRDAEEGMKAVDEQLRKNGGPFVLGEQVSYIDFFIAGFLQCARVIDETVFDRFCAAGEGGFKRIYDGCAPFMERKT